MSEQLGTIDMIVDAFEADKAELAKVLELADVKAYRSHGAGTDGPRWSCSLYVDGKRVAVVNEDGDGGPLRIDAKREIDLFTFVAMCKLAYPGVEFEAESLVIGDLLLRLERRQWCRKGAYFRLTGDPAGTWQGFSYKQGQRKVPLSTLVGHIRKKYGDTVEEILNERDEMRGYSYTG